MTRRAEPRTRVDRGIYRLGPDLYEVVVSRGWDPARKRYAQKSERVHGGIRDARAARARLLHAVDTGQQAGSDITLTDAIDAWLGELARVGRAPKTIKEYRGDADRYWIPTLGHLAVRKISRHQIQDVLDDLIGRGLAGATLHHVRACISGVFTHAVRQDWAPKDPTKPRLLVVPSARRRRPDVPTPDDVMLLMKAAAASTYPEMKRFGWIGAITGARGSEIRALRLDALHLEDGHVGIRHAISDGVLWDTKNHRERDVAVDVITVGIIEEQLAFIQNRAALLEVEVGPQAYLFSHDVECLRPISESWITHYFSALFDEIGAGHLTFKHLRKWAETYGQDLGFALSATAGRLGHDVATASKNYTGVVTDTDRALSKALAGLIHAD